MAIFLARVEAILCFIAVRLLGPVAAEIGQIAIHVSERDCANQINSNVHNGNLVQIKISQGTISGLFDIAEKIPKIQKIFINSFL